MPVNNPPLILASSSPYRKQLLSRLNQSFTVKSPKVDETAFAGETPDQTALRLAILKAKTVACAVDGAALVIGSDQVALCQGQAVNKPETHDRAVAQLQFLRGQTVTFYSALCLYDKRNESIQARNIPTHVTFRNFDDALIERYLRAEKPYDCAGSAKSEGLGIILIQSMQTDDQTALIGLPMITLTEMLMNVGYQII